MALFVKKYNPDRSPDWNYGGKKWRLSRSKIDLFVECPRCFYLDNKLGTGRPRGPAFTLNIAVDALFKKEFDVHRANKSAHPLMEQYGIDAVPYAHKDFETWRENFKGVEYVHPGTGFTISGAVDDVWQNKKGELIVVDYKSTSKNGKLEFEITLVPCEGDTRWIEPTLMDIQACLAGEAVPPSGSACEFCPYRETAGKKLQKLHTAVRKKKDAPSEEEPAASGRLL